MSKKREFRGITKKVEQVLIDSESARNNVDYCYMLMCSRANETVMNMPFAEVMQKRHKMGLPSYESVSRAWRKVQEKNENLRGSAWMDRHKLSHEVKGWAVNG